MKSSCFDYSNFFYFTRRPASRRVNMSVIIELDEILLQAKADYLRQKLKK